MIIHYMPAEERTYPRKYFALDLKRVPDRFLPRPLGGVPVGRRVVKIDMSAPIPDSKNEIPMPGEVFYPPGSPERCVHKSPKLSPAERKKADKEYWARRRNTGYNW